MTLYDNRYGTAGSIYGDVSGVPAQAQERKMLAQRLLSNYGEMPQGQMISGHYVAPSWTQQLAAAIKGPLARSEINAANKELKDYGEKKRQDIAAILSGQTPQQVTTSQQEQYLPAYEPSQMDRFGSPTAPREMQTRTVESSRTETPEEVQARLRPMIYAAASQYGNDPALQLMLGDLNYGRQRSDARSDKLDDRSYETTIHSRDRGEKLQDIESLRAYENIVRKEQQGFQLTMQEKQFAQQYKMQNLQQAFQAMENSKQRNFTAGENKLNRDQQLTMANDQRNFTSGENQLSRDAARENLPPLIVQGPDGQPMYVARNDALGMEAYVKSNNTGKVDPATQRANDATDVISILNMAEPLIEKSTGSIIGNAVDAGQRLYGGTNAGAQAAAQLKALEGSLVSKMPKMSGPQSDKDVLLYRQMAGQIGDPTIPAAQKQAAMKTIREINERYSWQQVDSPSSGVKKYNPKTGRIE